jgi:predicted DCC family thiol-disulfide oxidoreductase YuxK
MSTRSNTALPVDDHKLVVVYDGECPFCKNYVRLMALRQAAGEVELVDARTQAPAVRRLVELGYDLNEGMAATYGGRVYYGSDAVTLLSSMSSERGWLGRSIALLLRDPARAHLLYPALKLGRRIVLKLLGRPLIS